MLHRSLTTGLITLAAAAGAQAAEPGVHARHAARAPRLAPAGATVVRAAPPTEAPPPDVVVYGYYASWAGTLEQLAWERLTHVAVFNVDLNADGSVSNVDLWNRLGPEAVALAAPHGVRVHLTLTCFDDDVMDAVLGDDSVWPTTVETLGSLVDAHGADGVSVDCEGMEPHLRDPLTAFVAALQDRVDEVSIALPAVDWDRSYDYAALSVHADQLFIMGYGYHWSGGNPGPVAPLHGGEPWARWALSWTVEDYLDQGADPARIVLGLPLYGRTWPTTDTTVPGTATAAGSSVVMTEGIALAATHGRRWDAHTSTPYTFPSATSQTWYDDTQSVREKIHYAVEQDLAGVGFWALNYEGGDPAFWAMVAEETVRADPGDSGRSDDTGDGPGDDPGAADSGTSSAGDTAAAPDNEPGTEPSEGGLQPEGDRIAPKEGCAAAGGAASGLLAGLALATAGRRRRSSWADPSGPPDATVL